MPEKATNEKMRQFLLSRGGAPAPAPAPQPAPAPAPAAAPPAPPPAAPPTGGIDPDEPLRPSGSPAPAPAPAAPPAPPPPADADREVTPEERAAALMLLERLAEEDRDNPEVQAHLQRLRQENARRRELETRGVPSAAAPARPVEGGGTELEILRRRIQGVAPKTRTQATIAGAGLGGLASVPATAALIGTMGATRNPMAALAAGGLVGGLMGGVGANEAARQRQEEPVPRDIEEYAGARGRFAAARHTQDPKAVATPEKLDRGKALRNLAVSIAQADQQMGDLGGAQATINDGGWEALTPEQWQTIEGVMRRNRLGVHDRDALETALKRDIAMAADQKAQMERTARALQVGAAE